MGIPASTETKYKYLVGPDPWMAPIAGRTISIFEGFHVYFYGFTSFP